MKFYVIWSDGRKFGPADADTLSQWAKEGRITRDTEVENAETGMKGRARDIQGITWPTSAPQTDLGGSDPTLKAGEKPMAQQSSIQIPGQPQPYVAGQPRPGEQSQPQSSPYDPLKPQEPAPQQNPYQNPPQAGSPYPRDAGYNRHLDDGSQKMISTAWALIIVGFLCCFIATPFGIYNAKRAKLMGNPNADTPFIVGWVLFGLQLAGLLVYVIIFAMAFAQGAGGTSPFPPPT